MDNISPIDGRYRKYTQHLSPFFSEYGLFKYRLKVEIYYLLELLPVLKIRYGCSKIEGIYKQFNERYSSIHATNKCKKIQIA